MRLATICTLALMICFVEIHAKSSASNSPTLSETTDWIRYNLSPTAYFWNDSWKFWVTEDVSFKGCSFEVVRSIRVRDETAEHGSSTTVLLIPVRSGEWLDEVDHELYTKELYGSEIGHKYHFSGKLSQFDPSRIAIQRVNSDDPPAKAWDVDGMESASVKHVSFVVDDSKAERLVTAFRHAINLCGGKPEPF